MVSDNPSSSLLLTDIMMMSLQQVMVATRSKDYGFEAPTVNGKDVSPSSQPSASIPPPCKPLQIEKPNPDMMIRLPP